jgi:hypothetical protein
VPDVLSERALNRTLLRRQLLLERSTSPVDAAIDHLVGMQAQAPLAPYVGLWSRLVRFDAASLSDRIADRRAVRATAMLRSTIHLFNADDSLALRPVLQGVLERSFRSSPFARNLVGIDLDAVLAAGREILDDQPRTVAELARLLGDRWPDRDGVSLAYAVRYLVPLVQVPPRGTWGATGSAKVATLESWLGRGVSQHTAPDRFVLRYLAAYGPATVADITTWSWLTGLREVVERLRPQLRTYRDAAGREMFDVPDGQLASPDEPAPVRFLPEYDNVLLSHDDRGRIVPAGRKVPLPSGNGGVIGTVLVDGYLRATWRIVRTPGGATLTIEPDTPLAPTDRTALEEEGDALLRFAADDPPDRRIRFEEPRSGDAGRRDQPGGDASVIS